MKKIFILIFFKILASNSLAQYVTFQPSNYSPSEQKALSISKQKIDCIWGDCENGKGRLLVSHKFSKKGGGNEYQYSIEGNFKTGLLNGFGKITRYYGENFSTKKGVAFDSLEAVKEIYNSLDWITNLTNKTGHEGSFGFFKNGKLLEGTYINDYRNVLEGIFNLNQLVYGSIKEEKSESNYKGFTTIAGTGLGLIYKKDSVELFPHRFQKKLTDFRLYPESEYATGRTSVVKNSI